MPVPYISWPDEDRVLMDILAEQVREPLVRWFRDEIRARYQAAQAEAP